MDENSEKNEELAAGSGLSDLLGGTGQIERRIDEGL